MRSGKTAGGKTCLAAIAAAVALALSALLFCSPHLSLAEGETDVSGSSGSESSAASSYEDADAVDIAKTLIAALPADPDVIDESSRGSIEAATAAYNALLPADQQALDSETLDKEQSYGRWLESAQWGLAAATESIDDTTDLSDGDYSAYITSTSSMGKSTSERARSWSVASLSAKDCKLTAVIRCDSRSAFKNLRIAGTDYSAVYDDGVPQFTVPFQANVNLKFTVDASDIADSIAYEIEADIDLSEAGSSEVAQAKSLAAEALAGIESSWDAASKKAVRSAARALATVAGKDGVKRVELELFEAGLSAARKAVKTKKGSGSAAASGTKKKGSGGGTGSGSAASSGGLPRSMSGSSSTGSGSSASADAGTSSSTSSARSAVASKTVSSKRVKASKVKAVETLAGGASSASSSGSTVSSESAQSSAEPNYPLLLGLGAGLLFLGGMVLRSVLFNRQMGLGSARQKGGESGR